MDRFKAGHITRIKVKSFMTYDELEIIPNQGLNFIIGLNGSGKSSIMSAICLGLAGKPQYTGKSGQPSHFIKHNHSKAIIEIELKEPKGENVVISRTIHREKSTYLLNGSLSSPANVMSVVKRFNIDVGNLCQFLPQEKVADFSKMDRKQRLQIMLQAIGEPQMFTTFDQLKHMHLDCKNLEKHLLNLNNDKEADEQITSRLKIDVEKQEARKRLIGELEIVKLQKKILIYDGYQKNHNQLKVKKKQLKAQKQKVEKEIAALEQFEIGKVVSERDECINEMKQTEIKALHEKVYKNSSNLTDMHEKVQLAKMDFRNMITEKQNHKTKVAELLKQITGLQTLHDILKNEQQNVTALTLENSNHQFKGIKTELSELDHEMFQINSEINNYNNSQKNLQFSIDKIKNEKDKKMQFLKQKFRPCYEAVTWLQENNESFKSTICEPAILSIKIDDNKNSKFIENTVGIRDLLAFVCQEKDDVKRLTSILREEKKLPVNVAHAPESSNYNSPQITNHMKQLGVKCYLKDLFSAPDLVMSYLCQIYKVHLIPICHDNAENNVNAILERCKVFFTENYRYSGTRSKYGAKHLSVKRDQFSGKGFLLSYNDQSEQLEQFVKQLRDSQQMVTIRKEQLEELNNKRFILERRQEQNRAEKAELQNKIERIETIEKQLQQKTELYNIKESEIIDEREEKTKETKNIRRLNNEKVDVLLDIGSILKEYHVLKLEKVKQITLAMVLNQKVKVLTDKLKETRTLLVDMESRKQELQKEANHVTEKAHILWEELKKEDKEVVFHIYQNLAHLSLENVEKKIVNIQAQLELNCEENHSVIQEYEERQIRINFSQKCIREMEERISKLKNDIYAKKIPWLQRLETHIQNINAKFTQYYKFLNFAGEISLYQSEDTDNLLKYGLQIRLKYRAAEDFIELSQTHHSGGECSVAAIIFILSLQELNNVPFRCIDEINQGMDTVNEMKIHQLIADASTSGSSCSQYFILTPKLLRDLGYHENAKVHIIFNAQHPKMKYNIKKHLLTAATTKN